MEFLALEEFVAGFGAAFAAALCGVGVIALFTLVWLAEEDRPEGAPSTPSGRRTRRSPLPRRSSSASTE